MKNLIKRFLSFLLNKTGYFIIIDMEKVRDGVNDKDGWNHYSFNLSFWAKKLKVDAVFMNGESASVEELAMWSKHLTGKEVNKLQK